MVKIESQDYYLLNKRCKSDLIAYILIISLYYLLNKRCKSDITMSKFFYNKRCKSDIDFRLYSFLNISFLTLSLTNPNKVPTSKSLILGKFVILFSILDFFTLLLGNLSKVLTSKSLILGKFFRVPMKYWNS